MTPRGAAPNALTGPRRKGAQTLMAASQKQLPLVVAGTKNNCIEWPIPMPMPRTASQRGLERFCGLLQFLALPAETSFCCLQKAFR